MIWPKIKLQLLPKTLFGRLVFVLLVGLIIAQSMSTFILLLDRGSVVYQAIQTNLIERASGIVKLLNALPAESRVAILPLFSSNDLHVYLSERALSKVHANAAETPATALVKSQLLKQLPEGSEVSVSLDGSLMNSPMLDSHMSHMMFAKPSSMHPNPMPQQHSMVSSFHIQIRLQDGSWVIFEHGISDEFFNWPLRLLSILGILLLSVIALSLVAVSLIIKPLSQLRHAAEGLGKDIMQSPLAEKGPIEIKQTAIAFNTMQRRLRNYIDDRAQILAAVSHDLKTPLTRLRLRAELLDDEAQRDKTLQDLDEMESMVNATLDFMRGISNNEVRQGIDIMALLESLQADAQESGGDVKIEGSVSEPFFGKPLALKRCVVNLLENALRYASKVSIAVSIQGQTLLIAVCDRGPGIPEKDLVNIFEPFFRLESSRARKTGGSGLGLGIARNIARAHGGDLVIFNRSDGGLCAEIQLPHQTG